MEVEGWPTGSQFEIQPMRLRYEHTQYVFATTCPPVKVRHDVMIGFPRRNPNTAT